MRNLLLLPLLSFVITSCHKSGDEQPPAVMSYEANTLYATGETARPRNAPDGAWSSFPEGLDLDPATGAVNAARSEKGMRYRITVQTANRLLSTYVTVAGINYRDRYYRLSDNDSIAFPIYNADLALPLPAGTFDDDRTADASGCAVRTGNGQINLKESIRKGLFGATPQNNTRKEIEFAYRLNDASGNTRNKIKVLLYYFNTANDVPDDLKQTLEDHLAMTLQPDNSPLSARAVAAGAKPRPPCIVIIAH